MLNIIKKNRKRINIINFIIKNKYINSKDKSLINEYKNIIYYPSSNKEWFSSFYSYNKSYIKSWVVKYTILYKLLLSYCNILRNKKKTHFKRRARNKTRYSANKIYISKPELNTTSTKLSILLYTYNKKKVSIQSQIRKLITINKVYNILIENSSNYLLSYNKSVFNILKKNVIKKTKVSDSLKLNKNRMLLLLKNNFFFFNEWNMAFIKTKGNFLSYIILKHKKVKNLRNVSIKFLKKQNKLKKIVFMIAKTSNLNKFKYNNIILNLKNLGVIKLIEKMYTKKINIKLIEQKSIYLNSGIFSSAIMLKLRDRTNKPIRILIKAIDKKVKIPSLHSLITFDDRIEKTNKNNILSTLKQQVVSGVRFEASGRLTRRLTAMRAVFKYRYKGSLKNLRSSFNNKSATMLRGYVKSNLQYTIINSKTRNGTFGLKGWMSSH